LSELGEFKPGAGEVSEPTASTGVFLRGRGSHLLNSRSERDFSFGGGFNGSSNGRNLLGDEEPGAGIVSGVENGTVDRQGNPSSVPTFGADSRLVAETSGPELAGACLEGGWEGMKQGWKRMKGKKTKVKAGAAVAGLFLGCSAGMAVKVVEDELSEAGEKKAEEKKEGEGAKKKAGDEEKTGGSATNSETVSCEEPAAEEMVCVEPGGGTAEADPKEEDTVSTPKPEGDDNGNGRVRVSVEELGALVASGRRTLVNPGGGGDFSVSTPNAGMMDPFSRVKAKRDSQSYPEEGGDGRAFGAGGLPVGNVRDGLVQPVDPDGNTPSPTNPSSRH